MAPGEEEAESSAGWGACKQACDWQCGGLGWAELADIGCEEIDVWPNAGAAAEAEALPWAHGSCALPQASCPAANPAS